MSKQLKNTPKVESGNLFFKFLDGAKHFVLCAVVICCYVAVGVVILTYITHFILPEKHSWLTSDQKKLISDLLSGGFIVFVIGKITDKI